MLFYIGGSILFLGSGMFLTGLRGVLSRVIEKRFVFSNYTEQKKNEQLTIFFFSLFIVIM